MEVCIHPQNVMDDIGSKYMMELQTKDPMPPKGTVIQSLNEANARLFQVLQEFLDPYCTETADNSLTMAEDFSYVFRMSHRRAVGKAQPLADLIHSYLVNATLAKIFSSMTQANLADKHEKQAVSDSEAINNLLHTKLPPSLC